MAKKWQNDPEYVKWLSSMNYIDEENSACMSEGIYIYMWEAWLASRREKKQTEVKDNGTRRTIRRKKKSR